MLIEVILVLALGVSWESWSRYLKHKERIAGIRRSREGEVLQRVEHLHNAFQDAAERVDGSVEKNRAVLKTFLDSLTDIVKISEEEKSNLQNRLVASKLGKK